MELSEADIDRLVRRSIGKAIMRYFPLAGGLGAVLLVVTLVPSVTPTAGTRTPSPLASGPGVQGNQGQTPGLSMSTSVQGAGVGAPGTGSVGPTSSPSGSRGGGQAGQVGPAGGCRQVAWSKYSPLCVPAFGGNNGGATAPGVTGSTITVTYRNSNSAQAAAIEASQGEVVEQDSAYVSDLQNYIGLFNRSFQLYGRKVVLKTFNGQGDWLAEDAGQDLGAAQADAATAQGMGAFADVTNFLTQTVPYAQDLAAEHVIAPNPIDIPQSMFNQYQPYLYSYTPSADKLAQWYADAVCQRMNRLPAVFAGPEYHNTTRVFGMAVVGMPVDVTEMNQAQDQMSRCGARMAKRIDYALNPAQEPQEAVSIVAQMKAAGVTTLLCQCDVPGMQDIENQADNQNWHPEYMQPYAGNDAAGRLFPSDQQSHALSSGSYEFVSNVAPHSSEAYRAFKLAAPAAEPAGPWFESDYYSLLMFFSALQSAGPNLTAATFEQGLFSLPPSLPGGDSGTWRFGAGAFTPNIDSQTMWWSPTAPSNYDGKSGAYLLCDSGAFYPFADPGAWGPAQTQWHCFGT